jgi:Na+:H+ antiporter, NhaA family
MAASGSETGDRLVGPPTAGADHVSSARSPSVAARVADAVERFLHIEAISGILLLLAAAAALLWANSPIGASYQQFWHAPLTLGAGDWIVSQPLHFWINDGLMTIFFLVVGLEIRREMHEGMLASVQVALLPLAAALGGVIAPALIYLSVSADPIARQGWAVPTATDIAFAVGVLALLGRRVPTGLRVLLLALAVIDDIAAVVIIALFYSTGLAPSGLFVAVTGVLLVFVSQRLGFRSAFAYLLPGALLWLGLLRFGVHPTLAGVILGLLTPTVASQAGGPPMHAALRALRDFGRRSRANRPDVHDLMPPLKRLKDAQRELLPPAMRVQAALHPWVAYGVMPLFALANAGIVLDGFSIDSGASRAIAIGVFLALVVGKPVGIFLASLVVVRSGWCALPSGVTWPGVAVVGCLGGIGFTMAIFIATLAFADDVLLGAAKLGILAASAIAAILGLLLGRVLFARRPARGDVAGESPAATTLPQDHRS